MRFHYISLVFLIILIFLRFYLTRPVYKNGDNIRIKTKVSSEPILYDTSQYIKIKGLKAYLPKYPELTYGDRVIVTGRVDKDKLTNVKMEKIESGQGTLYNFRINLINFYKQSLPEPYSSLVAGMVIGSKNMSPEFWNKLKQTGTAHIVVASGTNISMAVSFMIGAFTYFLKRKQAIHVTIFGIFIYVILSGFDPPIVRAGIMGSILLIGQEKGRLVSTWRILIYTASIMLLLKPDWVTDLGFILSFTATMSLLIFRKFVDLRLKIIPAFFREGLSTSIAAQIGVAPILFATFGQFNILSPIINALIIWTIPYIMLWGAVAGLVGLFVPLVGRMILFVIFPLLWYFVKVIYLF